MKLKNSALQELYDAIFGGGTVTFTVGEDSPIDKAFKECDEKLSESITFAHIKDLEDRNDILEGSNKALLEANLELASKKRQLEKVRDNIRVELETKVKRMDEITKERDSYRDLYTELSKEFDKLSEENGRLNTRINRLRGTLMSYIKYIKHHKEQFDKIQELKARLNSMYGDEYLNKLLDSTRNDGYEQGQKDLWDKLQEVSDYYYFGGDDEFDTDDCEMTSMTDIIDVLNVDQFLEAYKNWHKAREQHRWEYEPIARRLPQPWTCTLEGTINVEINKDLLNKIYGIDSDD